ncbi:MAG: hypothetical protein AAGA60_28330 [Cyanobacteria bacterium P01_E01_bin.42]
MANRSYLYTYDSNSDAYRDLSEWKTHIPLIHLLLVGFETQTCESALWKVPYPLAIRGKAEPARELLKRFLEWIATQLSFEDDACKTRFDKEYQRTLTLLFQADRQSDLYHLEIGEILDLIGDPPEKEAESVKMYARDAREVVTEVQHLLNTESATFAASQNWYFQQAYQDWEKYLGLWFPGILFFHFK